MDEEEEERKFEMEENGEKEGKKRLDKEALCERLKALRHDLTPSIQYIIHLVLQPTFVLTFTYNGCLKNLI